MITKQKIIELQYAKIEMLLTLKHFITSIIPKGNNIICDGWKGYEWIDEANSDYVR